MRPTIKHGRLPTPCRSGSEIQIKKINNKSDVIGEREGKITMKQNRQFPGRSEWRKWKAEGRKGKTGKLWGNNG